MFARHNNAAFSKAHRACVSAAQYAEHCQKHPVDDRLVQQIQQQRVPSKPAQLMSRKALTEGLRIGALITAEA